VRPGDRLRLQQVFHEDAENRRRAHRSVKEVRTS
jgi:hypothetical protein